MCTSESVWLSNSGCQDLERGESAHIYNHVTYFLCDDSRDGRPCQNVKPSADEYSDAALPGSCPICEAIESATKKYEDIIAQARDGSQDNLEVTESQASRQKDKEIADAWCAVRIIRAKRGANVGSDFPQKKSMFCPHLTVP